MTNKIRTNISGGYFLWHWKDAEILNPGALRSQLDMLVKHGFSGILTNIGSSRYVIDDPRTLRIISQVSQWSRKRNLDFFLQIDPRQNSHSLICRTGERTKNLLLTREPHLPVNKENLNIAKVKDGNFQIKILYPEKIPTNLLQVRALSFEPHCLEKAFLFKFSNGVILKDTIRDITRKTYFFADIVNNQVEIFGEVDVSPQEDWYVAVFPKFNTNMYDFAGRDSNDILLEFIEELFDAFVNLDGVIWGKEDFGYISGINRIPVSTSIYNSFKAEYGYNLQDFLLHIILKINDNSHIKVRLDYYNLLMELIYDGVNEFHSMLNSFFHGVDISNHYSRHTQNHLNSSLLSGNVDPWRSLDRATVVYSETPKTDKKKIKYEFLLTTFVIAKSLSAHSKKKKVFHKIDLSVIPSKELHLWINLMSLYSINFVIDNKDILSEPDKRLIYKEYNKNIHEIKKFTGFLPPDSDYVLIFPIETIMTGNLSYDKNIIDCIYNLISELILKGIQIDVLSPLLLRKGKISDSGLQIGERIYKGLIYPFPVIIDTEVLYLLKLIEKTNIKIFMGGDPQLTTESKPINYTFSNVFDPYDKKLSFLEENSIQPLFSLPDNCIGSLISTKKKQYILLHPAQYGTSVKGRVTFKDYSFNVTIKDSLVMYELSGKGKVKRIL